MAPNFCTPRSDMHRVLRFQHHADALGSSCSFSQSAVWVVKRSFDLEVAGEHLNHARERVGLNHSPRGLALAVVLKIRAERREQVSGRPLGRVAVDRSARLLRRCDELKAARMVDRGHGRLCVAGPRGLTP